MRCGNLHHGGSLRATSASLLHHGLFEHGDFSHHGVFARGKRSGRLNHSHLFSIHPRQTFDRLGRVCLGRTAIGSGVGGDARGDLIDVGAARGQLCLVLPGELQTSARFLESFREVDAFFTTCKFNTGGLFKLHAKESRPGWIGGIARAHLGL